MSWFSWADFLGLLPVAIVAVGAMVVLLIEALSRREGARLALGFVGIGTLVIAAGATIALWSNPARVAHGALVTGPFTVFLGLTVLAGGALAILSSDGYAERLGFGVGEYHGLKLLALTGMLFLVAANELVTLFIAFELMSLAVYALSACNRGDLKGAEGAMKYFILGAFASAFLLYGLTLLYGATGTVYLDQMQVFHGSEVLKTAGLGLCFVGLCFKLGVVPFHAWLPDAYQGAPASVSGFMAVGVKTAGFAVLVRLLHGADVFGGGEVVVTALLSLLAVVTMIVGNIMALMQTSLKRLLAYSGIAHTGYVLIGVVAACHVEGDGLVAVLYYLAAYTAMTIGAFVVLTLLVRNNEEVDHMDGLAGLAQRRPLFALAMTVCLVSLVGMPPTGGFFGKLFLFKAGIDAGFVGLVIVAALATMLSIYYYLRPVIVMYTGSSEVEPEVGSAGGRLALTLATLGTLFVGLCHGGLYEYARWGVVMFLGGDG